MDYGNSMVFAVLVPIIMLVVVAVMMIEAAGSVDESTMTRLEGIYLLKEFLSPKC